jgi:hypothetical protein
VLLNAPDSTGGGAKINPVVEGLENRIDLKAHLCMGKEIQWTNTHTADYVTTLSGIAGVNEESIKVTSITPKACSEERRRLQSGITGRGFDVTSQILTKDAAQTSAAQASIQDSIKAGKFTGKIAETASFEKVTLEGRPEITSVVGSDTFPPSDSPTTAPTKAPASCCGFADRAGRPRLRPAAPPLSAVRIRTSRLPIPKAPAFYGKGDATRGFWRWAAGFACASQPRACGRRFCVLLFSG